MKTSKYDQQCSTQKWLIQKEPEHLDKVWLSHSAKESREDEETQSPHKGSQGETALYRVPTELTGQEETEVGPCKAICRTQETVVKTQRGLGRRSKRPRWRRQYYSSEQRQGWGQQWRDEKQSEVEGKEPQKTTKKWLLGNQRQEVRISQEAGFEHRGKGLAPGRMEAASSRQQRDSF